VADARALLPLYGRAPIDFTADGAPALSVLMVVHDRFPLTMRTLGSLRANFSGAIELIVVDSGSADETRHLGRYVRGARILRFEDNIGFLRGSNAALQLAQAPFVLFLNNDVELAPGALAAALARLADPSIGAVGAKLIRSHGALQEAGCIVWRDGWTAGYMRDAQPLAPEANFVRDVDYCSAAFLLARAAPVHELGGFDEAFAPGYYEDADLCLALAASGHRVVYDPAVVVRHLEHGTSDGVAAAAALVAAHRDVFFKKHRARLRFRYPADARAALFARSSVPSRGRVLFIEDQVPLRRLGQGFVRSNDIVAALAASGRQVTVYPLHPARVDPAAIYADMGETVEVMHERGLDELEAFLKARRGYYDTIWIARTHNLDKVKPILERGGTDVVGGVRIVLDTEAIGALREAVRREVMGEPPLDVDEALAEEFAAAWFCQAVVAVSEAEAARLRALGFTDVAVLGHASAPTPTPRPFEERAGLLFVGALAVEGSPNHDGLLWFADAVLPLIEAALGYETRLTVVGHVGDVDLSRLEEHPRVTLRQEVADLIPVYDRHRVFVAPTRFAAGIPYKVHEAASMGVPVVATALLAEQLGWQDGRELMAVPVGDAEGFARAVLAVYRDAAVWAALREAALARVAAECGTEEFAAAVEGVVGGRGDGAHAHGAMTR
ncbi:MAG TPA: glycosyltransferase, partial [Acetobacteraceae bacterium]